MFTLGDFSFDRMVGLVAENNDEIKYILKQCQEGNIAISAESTDVNDKNGTLVARSYKAKTGTMSITNAMLNVNAVSALNGTEVQYASSTAKIDMPKIITVKAGESITLTDVVEGSVRVKAFFNNGATGATYLAAEDGTATTEKYGWDADTKKLTAPLAVEGDATAPTKFVVKYMRSNAKGAVIKNMSNIAPEAVEVTIKALYIDPCKKGQVQAAYIYLPNFQPSPEVTIPLTAGETFDYTGDLALDYCSDDKELYAIYFPDEQDEDDL